MSVINIYFTQIATPTSRCFLHNTYSVQHNADILAHLLSNNSPNVTVLTEHGLTQENKKTQKLKDTHYSNRRIF